MVTQTHRFKCIVAALVLGVGFSLPASAQQTTLDELYNELLEADENNHERIEERIVAQWERSGSASMDLLLRRGQDALDEGDLQAALDHFSALVDHAPEFTEGYYGRATAYFNLDMVGQALDDLREVLVLNPRHFEAMNAVATVMETLDRPEDAVETYRRVQKLNPLSERASNAIKRLEVQLEGQAL